jgi:peptidoglycan/xylan/chitin deacetylase (PgdA/CDA1 family)
MLRKIPQYLLFIVTLVVCIVLNVSYVYVIYRNKKIDQKLSNLDYSQQSLTRSDSNHIARMQYSEEGLALVRQEVQKISIPIVQGGYFNTVDNQPKITLVDNYYTQEYLKFYRLFKPTATYIVEVGLTNLETGASQSYTLDAILAKPELYEQVTNDFIALPLISRIDGIAINLESRTDIGDGSFFKLLKNKLSQKNVNLYLYTTPTTALAPSFINGFDFIFLHNQLFSVLDRDQKKWALPLQSNPEAFAQSVSDFTKNYPEKVTGVVLDGNSYVETREKNSIIWQDTISYAKQVIPADIKGFTLQYDPVSKAPFTKRPIDKVISETIYINDSTAIYNALIALQKKNNNTGNFPFATGLTTTFATEPLAWNTLSDFEDANIIDVLNTDYTVTERVENTGRGAIPHFIQDASFGKREILIKDGYIASQKINELSKPLKIEKTGFKENSVEFTFDDGPDRLTTPVILDILKENNIKATFYVTGNHVRTNPETARRIVREGHRIANHTFYHPFTKLIAPKTLQAEIEATDQIIFETTGVKATLFRTPFNENGDMQTNIDANNLKLINSLGLTVSEFDVDSGDYLEISKQEIIDNVMKRLDTTKGGQILFHDQNENAKRDHMIEALPEIIKQIREKGYSIDPVLIEGDQTNRIDNSSHTQLITRASRIGEWVANHVIVPILAVLALWIEYLTIFKPK